MSATSIALKYVNYLWDDAKAAKLSPAAQLVYRSNLLGSDQRITNTGGGNTSAKIEERDPLTGRDRGSAVGQGIAAAICAPRLGKLLLALPGEAARACSRSTPPSRRRARRRRPRTHGGHVPALHLQSESARVVHRYAAAFVHPGQARGPHASQRGDLRGCRAAIGGAHRGNLRRRGRAGRRGCVRASNSAWRFREIVQRRIRRRRASCMGQHGLINWANDDKECYELTLRLIEQAAHFIESIRDKGRERRSAAQKYQSLARVTAPGCCSEDSAVAARAGLASKALHRHDPGSTTRSCASSIPTTRRVWPSSARRCPDHFLRTKIKPLYVAWNPQTEDVRRVEEAKLDGGSGAISQGLRGLLRSAASTPIRPRCATRIPR